MHVNAGVDQDIYLIYECKFFVPYVWMPSSNPLGGMFHQ